MLLRTSLPRMSVGWFNKNYQVVTVHDLKVNPVTSFNIFMVFSSFLEQSLVTLYFCVVLHSFKMMFAPKQCKSELNARTLDYLCCPVMYPLKSNYQMFLRCSHFVFLFCLCINAKKCMLQFGSTKAVPWNHFSFALFKPQGIIIKCNALC